MRQIPFEQFSRSRLEIERAQKKEDSSGFWVVALENLLIGKKLLRYNQKRLSGFLFGVHQGKLG